MENGNTDVIKGYIENVVYYNEGNDYAVLEIATEEGLLVTAVGNLPIPIEGERVVLQGSWIYHKEFGKQFSIDTFDKMLPEGTEGILQYLSAHTVKGVGPVTAEKIVRRFGEDTFDVLENHPEWLADIPGITLKKAATISESFREQNGLRGVVMFCKDYMGMGEAAKVYKRFGAGAVGVIKDNPYILCSGDYSVSFETADKIAMSIGFEKDSPLRLIAGVEYVLEYNAATNGHTCLPYEKLVKASAAALDIDDVSVSCQIDEFILEGALSKYTTEDTLYIMTNRVAEDENYVAKKLTELDRCAERFSGSDIIGLINMVETEGGIEYAELQKRAIYEALAGGVLILTGGPGTGKTTVVKALIRIFGSLGMKTVLAAPTGRAAKRMSEASSAEAKTIHRMLEMDRGADEAFRFNRNINNPLDEKVVIVDEASMIDLSLMSALLRAMRRGARLILIGDSDQLPSVGAGNILSDLIDSERIRTVCLTEIFRQSESSLIVTNAHKINNGQRPVLNSVDGDFFFVKRGDYEVSEAIGELITERLPKKYGRDIVSSIQVITPSKKGAGGVEILNAELQSKINPPSKYKAEKSAHGTVFRVGDKVMQVANNYSVEWTRGADSGMGIYNGDIGIIESIDNKDGFMVVRYEDKTVSYTFDLLDELELAYAITVHKSQGSEYPVVIIPAYYCAPMLLTRNLLYTAVTRARRMVVVVGRPEVIYKMVENRRVDLRYTALKWRILDYN